MQSWTKIRNIDEREIEFEEGQGFQRRVEPESKLRYVERDDETFNVQPEYNVPVPTWDKTPDYKLPKMKKIKKFVVPEPAETMTIIGHVTKRRMRLVREAEYQAYSDSGYDSASFDDLEALADWFGPADAHECIRRALERRAVNGDETWAEFILMHDCDIDSFCDECKLEIDRAMTERALLYIRRNDFYTFYTLSELRARTYYLEEEVFDQGEDEVDDDDVRSMDTWSDSEIIEAAEEAIHRDNNFYEGYFQGYDPFEGTSSDHQNFEEFVEEVCNEPARAETAPTNNDDSGDGESWLADVFEVTKTVLSMVAKATWSVTREVIVKLWTWLKDSIVGFFSDWFVETPVLSREQVLGICAIVAWAIIEITLYMTGCNNYKVMLAVRVGALAFLGTLGFASVSETCRQYFAAIATTTVVATAFKSYIHADTLLCLNVPDDPAREATLNGGEFDVLPYIVAGIATIATMHLVPNGTNMTSFLTKADRIPKALRGIGSMTAMVKEAIAFVREEIIVACGGTRSLDRAVPIDVTTTLDRIEKLATLEMMAKIPTEDNVRREIEQVFRSYYRLRQLHFGNRTITTLLDKYAGLVGSLMTKASAHTPGRSDSRPKPVVCMLRGASGVGKSELLYFLAADMLTDLGALDDVEDEDETEVRARITKCMYARMPEQEYWDGMEKQPIVLYDDFGQQVDSAMSPSIEFMELIRLANRFPYPLHMAKVEQKDTAYFSAKHMFATTNLQRINPNSIVEPEAIYTRIDFGYEVRVKPQYQINSASDRENDHRLDRTKVTDFTTDIYEFRPWDPATGAVGGDPIDYEELIRRLSEKRVEFETAHERSKQAIVQRVLRRRATREQARESTFQGQTMSSTWESITDTARICGLSRTRMTMAVALAYARQQRREINERFRRAIGPWKKVLSQLCVLGTALVGALAAWKLYKNFYARSAVKQSGRDGIQHVRVARYEGVSSTQAQELMTCVQANYYVINGMCPALGIRGRFFLFNEHYWNRIDEQFEFQKYGKDTKYTFKKNEVKVHKLTARDPNADVIVLEMPAIVPMVRTITHHFATIENMATLKLKRVAMVVPYREGWYHKVGKVVRFYSMDLKFGDDIKRMQALETDLPTVNGDCGGVYIIDDDQYQQKICGFHFASVTSGGALAFPLVEQDYEFLKGNTIVLNGVVKPPTALAPVEAVVTEGRVERVAPASVKSSIVPTPIHGEVCRSTVMPAKLGPLLKEGGPGIAGLSKVGGDIPHIDDDEINRAVASLKTKLYSDCEPEEVRRVLTFDEAVRGIEGHQFVRPINRARSAGYPWTLTSTNGKRHWFGEQTWTLGKECEEVREEVSRKEKLLKKGLWEPSLYTDTLKDETRPIEKVRAGKTRVFAAAPMDLLILTRMYFLGFFSFVMRNRIHNEVAVGIQCQSLEWDLLARRMLSRGNGRMIAGDFTNYDGTLHPKILLAVCDIVNDWYRDGNANVRKLLFEDIVHSWHVTGPYVTSWFKSQPSGNPGTAIFNSLYNSLAVRIAAMRIRDVEFNEVADMVSYGDDNLISVGQNADWLTQQALSTTFGTIGMTYTSETKGEVEDFRKLEEVTFLKRGFRFDKGEKIWMAPLNESSINERLNWQKKSKWEWEILVLNAEMAVFEWSLHDDESFEHWRDRIVEVFRMHGKHVRVAPLAYYRALVRDGRAAVVFPLLTYA